MNGRHERREPKHESLTWEQIKKFRDRLKSKRDHPPKSGDLKDNGSKS